MATYHVPYTAQQVEAAIGKGPIIQSGYWYVWDIAQMQYVSTGVVSDSAPFSIGAKESADAASASAKNAKNFETLSESWAVGGTGTREGEDTDNAMYWANQARQAAGGGVTSFNGRSGSVQPASGDYTAEQVGAIPASQKGAAGGVAAQAEICAVETGSTAASAYAVGEYFVYNGLLYKATTAVDVGDTITPGTNCAAVTVVEEIAAAFTELSEHAASLVRLNASLAEKLNAYGRGVNLLDNWYFLNPVNQRGQTEYTGVGYTVDRWYTARATGTLTLKDTGVVIANAGNNAYIAQEIENAEFLFGSTLTASALYIDKLITLTFILQDNKYEYSNAQNGGRIAFSTQYDMRRIEIWSSDGTEQTIVACKLELGDTQTLAHQDESGKWVLNDPPPDYGTELAKCQRYFVRYGGVVNHYIGFANASSTTVANTTVHLPTCLRTNPSIVYSANPVLRSGGSGGEIKTNSLGDAYITGNVLNFSSYASGLTKGTTYIFQIPSNATFDIIAEL